MTQRVTIALHDTQSRYRALVLVCFVFLNPLISCGDGSDPGGPRITAFNYVGQFPADPYTAVFAFSFDAPSGISTGTADFYVGSNAEPQVRLKMSELMAASGLPRNATSGEVAAALRFQSKVTSSSVDMYLQVDDNDNKKSNKARVTLRFDYE